MKIRLESSYFNELASMVKTCEYNNQSCNFFSEAIGLSVAGYSDMLYLYTHIIKYGYVVINKFQDEMYFQKYFLQFMEENLGAQIVSHNSNSKIEEAMVPTHYFNSAVAQPLHTDEGHAHVYPRYVLLACNKHADIGGETIIVEVDSLYKHLINEFGTSVNRLFEDDAIKFRSHNGWVEKPILLQLLNNQVGITFSVNFKEMFCTEEVYRMYNFIAHYIHQRENQIRFKLFSGQILLIDNVRLLHGRTSFMTGSQRSLIRYWFGECSV